MAANTVIQIKRSQTTDAPPTLANGELAYSFSSNKLFIGQTSNSSVAVTVEYIGGKLIVDKVANLENIVTGAGSTSYANLTVSNTFILTGSSYSNNGVLIVKAGGTTEAVSGTSGKVFQVASNGTPYFDDLNGGTY